MNIKRRILYFSLFTIVILAIAIITWLNETGKISLFADTSWQPTIAENCTSANRTVTITFPTTPTGACETLSYSRCETGSSSCMADAPMIDAGSPGGFKPLVQTVSKNKEYVYTFTCKTDIANPNPWLRHTYQATIVSKSCSPVIPTATPTNTSTPTPTPTPTPSPTITPTVTPTPSPSPTATVTSCAAQCASSGYGTATCRDYAVIPSVQRCASNEVNLGTTGDCTPESGMLGGSKSCCCQSGTSFVLSTTRSANDLILSWNQIPDATIYRVFSCENALLGETTSTSLTLSNVADGQYCYIVFAYNSAGEVIMNTARTTVDVTSDGSSIVDTEDVITTTTGISTSSAISLISTGSNLWINLLISLLLIASVGYFVFKDKIYKK